MKNYDWNKKQKLNVNALKKNKEQKKKECARNRKQKPKDFVLKKSRVQKKKESD